MGVLIVNSNSWTVVLGTGPQGSPGPQGAAGPQGRTGNTYFLSDEEYKIYKLREYLPYSLWVIGVEEKVTEEQFDRITAMIESEDTDNVYLAEELIKQLEKR